MKVKDLQKLLENADPDLWLATVIWTEKGEKTYTVRTPATEYKKKDRNGNEYLVISFVDDCPADRIV